MKLNKILFYIGVIICMITLPLSIYLTFGCEKCNIKSLETEKYNISNEINKDLNVNVYKVEKSDTTTFIVNILLNIFAGSVVLVVTSLINYLKYRRELLNNIMNECLKYSKLFEKLEYFAPKVSNDDEYAGDEKELEDCNKDKIKEVLKTYVSFSEESLNELWSKYDDLDFITDLFKRKKKKYLYWNEIFDFIDLRIRNIKINSYHFKIYLSSANGNYKVNEEKLMKLQNDFFFIKKYNGEYDDEIPNLIKKINTGYTNNYNYDTNTGMFYYNKASDHLLEMFKNVGKDNYFDKKYKG